MGVRFPRALATMSVALLAAVGAAGCREKLMQPGVDPMRMDAAPRDTGRAPPARDTGSTPEPDAAGPAIDGPAADSNDARVGPTDAVPPDVTADRMPDGPGADLGPAPGNCGLARPDLSMVTGAGSVAVGADGTIYFAHTVGTDGFIGRLRPGGPAAMALQPRLARIPNGSRLWGMAMDRNRNVLYVASASGRAIVAINVQANPPTVRDLVIGVPAPNDLAWHEGHVYYSEQSDRRIYRLNPVGVRSQVTPMPLGDPAMPITPAGLAFGPGGALYVGSSMPGPITKLTLAAGVEQSRERFGVYNGVANSLAFDSGGRLYVAAYASMGNSQIVRLDAGGGNPMTVLMGSQLASLAFGQGMLDCRDLYVTSRPGAMLRVPVDVPGAP